MAKIIGVFSGKGGVGKTTLVANLGAALTNVFHKNVLILDSNINSSHLGLHFGIYEDLPVTLKDVLEKKVPITAGIYIHPTTGVRMLPAPLSGDGVSVTQGKLKKILNVLKKSYDMILVDSAPGLGKDSMVTMNSVDNSLLITTPDIPAVTDAIKSKEILSKLHKTPIGIVVNRKRNTKYELRDEEIGANCELKVLSSVPEDAKVQESVSKGVPVVLAYPNSKASRGFIQLAAALVGENNYEPSMWDKLRSFFGMGMKITPPIELPERQNRIEERENRIPKKMLRSNKNELENVEKMREQIIEDLKQDVKDRVRKKLKERLANG